jgi:hypothetical protein
MPVINSLEGILEPDGKDDTITPMNSTPPQEEPEIGLDIDEDVLEAQTADRTASSVIEKLMNELPGLNRISESSNELQSALAEMQDSIAQDAQPNTEAYMFLTDIKERMVYMNSLLSSLEKEILTVADDLNSGMEQFDISWLSTDEEMEELDEIPEDMVEDVPEDETQPNSFQ